MSELLILIALAWFLRNWIQISTDQDCEDWIMMTEVDGGDE
jgi:hypothetical protein